MLRLRTIGVKVKPSARARVRLPEKRVEDFYNSPEWKALMKHIIKERGRACQDPDHDRKRPRTGIRLYGDHIVERKDGGAPLDPRNILLRCGSCHTRKTVAQRAKRYALPMS